jgi:lipopolysaccharide/colanic/teichoic acid biosynthesis glycosyltransferase
MNEQTLSTNGAMRNQFSETLNPQFITVGTDQRVFPNGAQTNSTHDDLDEISAGSENRLLREAAFRRYHLSIKPIINPALFSASQLQSPPVSRKNSRSIFSPWQRFKGEWLIAPFFLFGSLTIILLAPEKLVKKITAPFTKADFWDQVGKRSLDFLGAVSGFIFSSIFFIVVPIFIKIDSKGPVFYGQQRAGLNYRKRDRRQVNIAVAHDRRIGDRRQQDLFGRPFTVYKFRTMKVDAERHSGAVWAQKDDPRITRMGRILRFIHIDEIPQFFNVLCGEMSLVGPRPERPQIMTRLIDDIPQFPERLQVKPGITGIAQIYCGYDSTIDDAREKLRYDLMYVKNSTFKYDVQIMLKTLWMIINGREVAKP